MTSSTSNDVLFKYFRNFPNRYLLAWCRHWMLVVIRANKVATKSIGSPATMSGASRKRTPTADRLPSTDKKERKQPRPPATLNGADWKTSKAKMLVSQDIIDGLVPVTGPYDVEALFNQYYKDHEYFANFPFDQQRYTDRIDRLRKAIGKLKHWADYDDEALKDDLLVYLPKQTNVRGESRWEGSEAERLLKLDIDNGVHLEPGYAPKKLYNTTDHFEFRKFHLSTFRKHVRQEIISRKTFDEKTIKKRHGKYKVGRYGNKEMQRQSTKGDSVATSAEV